MEQRQDSNDSSVTAFESCNDDLIGDREDQEPNGNKLSEHIPQSKHTSVLQSEVREENMSKNIDCIDHSGAEQACTHYKENGKISKEISCESSILETKERINNSQESVGTKQDIHISADSVTSVEVNVNHQEVCETHNYESFNVFSREEEEELDDSAQSKPDVGDEELLDNLFKIRHCTACFNLLYKNRENRTIQNKNISIFQSASCKSEHTVCAYKIVPRILITETFHNAGENICKSNCKQESEFTKQTINSKLQTMSKHHRSLSDSSAADKTSNKQKTMATKQFAKTYPMSHKTSLSADDLEVDTIIAIETVQKYCPNTLLQRIPNDYAEMSTDGPQTCRNKFPFKKRQPDQDSKIVIPHKYADFPEGDPLGARIVTYDIRTPEGRPYHRHFFVDVQENLPAGKMKIKDNDELVLLNGSFVPNINHNDLLNVFHKVKVDGKTRLYLVIRRKWKDVAKKSIKKWEWIETSAILAPDHRSIHDEHYKTLGDDGITNLYFMYKVSGSQLYLAVSANHVFSEVMTGQPEQDKTKHLLTQAKPVNNPSGIITWDATLSDKRMESYIGMNDSHEIILLNEPVWFKMTWGGSEAWFTLNEKYLACNKVTGHVETNDHECRFEKVPYKDEDHPDNSLNHLDSFNGAASFMSKSSLASGGANDSGYGSS